MFTSFLRYDQDTESTAHVLRDCEVATEVWNHFVSDNKWSRFFSVGFHVWLKDNLDDKNGDWPIIFGVVCWSLWCHGNKVVFQLEFDSTNYVIYSSVMVISSAV
jgi:hypothetical protein